MTRTAATLLVAAVALGVRPADAQEVLSPSSLKRPNSHVIVRGARLDKLQGTPLGELRLFAWDGKALSAIPFQIDERTHDEGFAYELGRHPLSDTDQLFDANDELVFMAEDVGSQVAKDAIRLGQETCTELRIFDPVSGEHGWVYLLRYTTAPPPPSAQRYLTIDWQDGEFAGWTGPWVEVACSPRHGNLFDLAQLSFVNADRVAQPNVLDRAKVAFNGTYLFLDIERAMDEMRAQIISYVQGPIRLVASLQVEAYLIWDHWVRSTRGRLKLYANRLEIEFELALPVPLEAKSPSELRFSFDFLPRVGPFKIRTNTNARGLKIGTPTAEDLRKLDRSLPRWIHASLPSGTILTTLKLESPLLGRKGHALFLENGPAPDPPESSPGSFGNVGYSIGLTGLPAGKYGMKLVVQFGRAQARPAELLRVADVPLSAEASR